MSVPLNVSIRVPSGVKLVTGPSAYSIPAGDGPRVHHTEYVFAFENAPPEDLVLVADVQTASFGIHAEDAYRFGRPVPVRPSPKATGPHLRIGDIDLGPSVPIK